MVECVVSTVNSGVIPTAVAYIMRPTIHYNSAGLNSDKRVNCPGSPSYGAGRNNSCKYGGEADENSMLRAIRFLPISCLVPTPCFPAMASPQLHKLNDTTSAATYSTSESYAPYMSYIIISPVTRCGVGDGVAVV